MATVGGPSAAPRLIKGATLSIRPVTFSSSYTTGGEAVSAGSVGLGAIYGAIATVTTPAASVVEVFFNRTTGKLVALTAAGEVANATNLSSLVCEVFFIGA